MRKLPEESIHRLCRRAFLGGAFALGASTLLGPSRAAAADPPPETRKIRILDLPAVCFAPQYLAEEFLRMEGFAEVEYVKNWTGSPATSVDEHRVDFTMDTAPSLLPSIDSGGSAVALAGVHVGCYELFANDRVHAIRDLKGKAIAIPAHGSPDHMLLSSMLAYVGIDPNKDVKWIVAPWGTGAMTVYLEGKADAYFAFAPQGEELRSKKAGRAIINTALDRPWSQYFCCMLVGHREYTVKYPHATKRALRAFLKANDVCAQDPQRAARMLVDKGIESRYAVALNVLQELEYRRWREANPEDTLRFHALRLHEVGMIKGSPQRIVSQSADWRFLNELRRELKG